MKINKYLENGIGFNCNTCELKDLNLRFLQSKELLEQDLTSLEERKNELKKVEFNDSALDVVKRDLYFKGMNELNSKINLIIIALQYNNINEFIEKKLK